uniref:Uncharacterized protein n=1 Tax=viral metagenome TaxID=1070528 RepID=A0A6C0KGN1_9ZZZZ
MIKKKIKKRRRNTSEKGKIRNLGNSKSGFCTFCRPKLAIRLHKCKNIKQYLEHIEKNNYNENII